MLKEISKRLALISIGDLLSIFLVRYLSKAYLKTRNKPSYKKQTLRSIEDRVLVFLLRCVFQNLLASIFPPRYLSRKLMEV